MRYPSPVVQITRVEHPSSDAPVTRESRPVSQSAGDIRDEGELDVDPGRAADARRNYDRIRTAAGAVIAEHGANASLEEIARRAGVGSATLHRHFPFRQALLEAVFRERVETPLHPGARTAHRPLPPLSIRR